MRQNQHPIPTLSNPPQKYQPRYLKQPEKEERKTRIGCGKIGGVRNRRNPSHESTPIKKEKIDKKEREGEKKKGGGGTNTKKVKENKKRRISQKN